MMPSVASRRPSPLVAGGAPLPVDGAAGVTEARPGAPAPKTTSVGEVEVGAVADTVGLAFVGVAVGDGVAVGLGAATVGLVAGVEPDTGPQPLLQTELTSTFVNRTE
jgi:hypothetical protein